MPWAALTRMAGRWSAIRRPRHVLVRDGALAVVLTGLAFVPVLAENRMELGELPRRPLDALAVLAALAQCLPLTVRRRWPALCVAVVATGFAVQQLRGYSVFTGVAVLIALYSAAAYQQWHRRTLAAALTVGYVVLALALHRLGSPEQPLEFGTFYLAMAGCWLAGNWIRAGRAAEDERQRLGAEAARAAERAAIARELHDVVTHHVTAMVVQADAAQYLTGVPAPVAVSLETVSATGRQALAELRHLLGVLDPGEGSAAAHDRAPAFERISDLVKQTRAAGQPVDLTEDGRPPPAPGAPELAAYRVVQEALTNVLKYAPGSPTAVRVHHHDDLIDVEITNDAPAGPPPPTGGTGRGLVGLRERVGILGGEFSAGGGASGGFTVHARIPTQRQP